MYSVFVHIMCVEFKRVLQRMSGPRVFDRSGKTVGALDPEPLTRVFFAQRRTRRYDVYFS